MIVAPMSASSYVHHGPANTRLRSSTVIPTNAAIVSPNLSVAAMEIRRVVVVKARPQVAKIFASFFKKKRLLSTLMAG